MQELLVAAGRQVVVERHRVDVPGDHHALLASQLGVGDDRVATTGHHEVVDAGQRLLHLVGDLLLVEAHRGDVDQLLGQRDGVGGEVERHAAIQAGRPPATRSSLTTHRSAQDSRGSTGARRREASVSTLKRRWTRFGNRIGVWMYRTLDGRLSSGSKDVHVLMITTPGRRTGVPRSTCVRYLDTAEGYVVWGTGSGSPRDPDWFRNLRAAKTAEVQVRARQLTVVSRELVGADRDAMWNGRGAGRGARGREVRATSRPDDPGGRARARRGSVGLKVEARSVLVGKTQNSLPSGSASTVQSGMSQRRVAPAASSASTSPVTSQCTRLGPTRGSGTGAKSSVSTGSGVACSRVNQSCPSSWSTGGRRRRCPTRRPAPAGRRRRCRCRAGGTPAGRPGRAGTRRTHRPRGRPSPSTRSRSPPPGRAPWRRGRPARRSTRRTRRGAGGSSPASAGRRG